MWTVTEGEMDAVQDWIPFSNADNPGDGQLSQEKREENLDMTAPNEAVVGLIAGGRSGDCG